MKALHISALCKTYDNGFTALDGIDLAVESGAFFGLLGPNGAGKTTAIGIITSLVKKTSGTVKVFGIDIDTDFPKAKKMIGVVPQEFNFSIFEKVQDIVIQQAGYYGIPRKTALERCEKYLKALGLWDKRNGAARELSGGMKRRLMIARGLIHEPRLLILDEPTAGVDVELRRGMWTFLEGLSAEGRTIILTTHYLEEAERLCDRIAFINRGRIIENADKRSLLGKLDRETLILEIRNPLDEAPKLEEMEITLLDNTTLQVTRHRTLCLNALFVGLDRLGIQVEGIRYPANRLETLYMEMTHP